MGVVRYLSLLAVVAAMVFSVADTASAESANGERCRVSVITKEAKSFVFHSVLVRLRMKTSWCFDGQQVTRAEVVCKIEKFDRITISVDRCQPQRSFESWRGRAKGSVYALTSLNYSNCIIIKSIGCVQSATMNIEATYYGDGSVKEES